MTSARDSARVRLIASSAMASQVNDARLNAFAQRCAQDARAQDERPD
jgi:hypothetical protein